jgi:signal peptidase
LRLIEAIMPALRVLQMLLRYAGMTVAGFAIGVGLAMVIPLAFHARPLVVLSGSMEPALHTGDITVVRTIAPLETRPGDIVTFRDPENADRLITHRVREMHMEGDAVVFRTRGDVNNASENWQVSSGEEIGRVLYRIPKLGWGLMYARSKGLFVLMLGGALALLLVLELASIWRAEENDSDSRA